MELIRKVHFLFYTILNVDFLSLLVEQYPYFTVVAKKLVNSETWLRYEPLIMMDIGLKICITLYIFQQNLKCWFLSLFLVEYDLYNSTGESSWFIPAIKGFLSKPWGQIVFWHYCQLYSASSCNNTVLTFALLLDNIYGMENGDLLYGQLHSLCNFTQPWKLNKQDFFATGKLCLGDAHGIIIIVIEKDRKLWI